MKRVLRAVGALQVHAALTSSSGPGDVFSAAAAASASAARPSGITKPTATAGTGTGTGSRTYGRGDGPYIPKTALPGPDKWTSVEEGVEFLPAEGFVGHDLSGLPPSLHRHLRSQLTNPYSVQPFVNGESDYDEYQQAWRYLGFVIDCDSNMDDDSSWDGGTGEGCQRYLIWAAVSYSSFKCLPFYAK